MARKSPPKVNQTYETGCTWRLFGIFNFREGHSNRRLVSSSKHLDTHATAAGNGKSRSSSDALSTIDEKSPHIGVSSRRRDYGCKSISCVENDRVTNQGIEVRKMTIDGRFVKKNYQGKDGAGCQANQLMDALQILYSNKELFLKLLQDPNSLLVKQIHDFPSFQVKEPYQARMKRMTRLNKFQNSNARQCAKPCKSFDRHDSNSSCEPQSSNRIVVLKPETTDGKKFADTSFGCPWPHSPTRFGYNVQKQNVKCSHFSFGRINTKLRYVTKVRRKEQQWITSNGVPYKFAHGCQCLEDGKKVKELETTGRNSLTNVFSSVEEGLNTSLDLKKSHKIIKVKDTEICTGQEEAASFVESCSRNTNNTISSSEEDNINVEGRKSLSEMLNFGTEEYKQCRDSLGRPIPLNDFESFPSLQRYCDHGYVNDGTNYDDNYQMALRTRLDLQQEVESGSFSSLGQKINDPPAIVKTPSNNLQLFSSDISIRKSLPGDNLHAYHDLPRDGGFRDSYTQYYDINNAAGGVGPFQDSNPEIQILSFSPEVASSSSSPSQRKEDNVNMGNRVERPSTEFVVEQFTGDDIPHPPITIFQPDEPLVQVVHDKFDTNYFVDLIRSSLDPVINLTISKDNFDYLREILQAFSLKWDELVMKFESCDQMQDPSTYDELKGLTGQLSGNRLFLDCVIEILMEIYQTYGFLPHISTKSPNIQAHVVKNVLVKEIMELINLHFLHYPSPMTLEQLVEKDLARRGSCLNIQVDVEDIAMEVGEHILEKLVLEIVS